MQVSGSFPVFVLQNCAGGKQQRMDIKLSCRLQGIVYPSMLRRVKCKKYKDESNLSNPPPAPAAAPDSGSVPLYSGRPSGKSHCPPSAGLLKPEAAHMLLCALWRAGKCQSLHRCRSPSLASAGGCRPACPRLKRTRDRRFLALLGSRSVPAGSWCHLDCRWTLDDSVSSFSSCLSGKVLSLLHFTKPEENNFGKYLKKSTDLITTQTTISTMIKMTTRTATTLRMMVRRRSKVNKSKK